MTYYVQLALKWFQHLRLNVKTDAPPHEWKEPVYGIKIKYTDDPDTSPILFQEKKTYAQKVVRVFLYYAQAVYLTILTTLNSIVGSQSAPNEKTLAHCTQLLYYLSWHPQVAIEYKSMGKQLWVYGDAAYLVAAKSRSRISSYFFLSDTSENSLQLKPTHNSDVLVGCQILKYVVAGAAEP